MTGSFQKLVIEQLSEIVDKRSGTTKAQRDQWSRNFWQYLDQNGRIGQSARRWQKAGCDLRKVAMAVHSYVTTPNKHNEQRKERGKLARRILRNAARILPDLESLYRAYGKAQDADGIAKIARQVGELRSRCKAAFNSKHLGTSRPWKDLAMLEGFVFEATGTRPTAHEIVDLIRAGRHAAGVDPDIWETNADVIRKGLEYFKKNTPYSQVWTSPSKCGASELPQPW